MVPDIGAAHPENYVFDDVCGVIANSLKIACNEQGVKARSLVQQIHEFRFCQNWQLGSAMR
jgi:hypothetical protein